MDERAEKRTEKILNFGESFANIMANVPETEKLIMLVDIVGFSRGTTREQVHKIYLFQRYLMAHLVNNAFSFQKKVKISHFVPTGDGCYIIAEKCDSRIALHFLTTLLDGLKKVRGDNQKPLSLRISALTGSCVPFMDIAHHKNYIGDGMNEAARILSGGQHELEALFLRKNPDKTEADAKEFSQNALYLGDSLADAVTADGDECGQVFRFDAVTDKHGKMRAVTVVRGE